MRFWNNVRTLGLPSLFRSGEFAAPVEGHLRGELGCSFKVSVHRVDEDDYPDFTDEFEPDDGPLTASDSIVDDGESDKLTSGVHTGHGEDEDWIEFFVQPDTTYRIGIRLNDALYDPEVPDAVIGEASFELVPPDGNAAGVLDASRVRFESTDLNSVADEESFSWSAPGDADSDDAYFIRVYGFRTTLIECEIVVGVVEVEP